MDYRVRAATILQTVVERRSQRCSCMLFTSHERGAQGRLHTPKPAGPSRGRGHASRRLRRRECTKQSPEQSHKRRAEHTCVSAARSLWQLKVAQVSCRASCLRSTSVVAPRPVHSRKKLRRPSRKTEALRTSVCVCMRGGSAVVSGRRLQRLRCRPQNAHPSLRSSAAVHVTATPCAAASPTHGPSEDLSSGKQHCPLKGADPEFRQNQWAKGAPCMLQDMGAPQGSALQGATNDADDAKTSGAGVGREIARTRALKAWTRGGKSPQCCWSRLWHRSCFRIRITTRPSSAKSVYDATNSSGRQQRPTVPRANCTREAICLRSGKGQVVASGRRQPCMPVANKHTHNESRDASSEAGKASA